MPKLRNKKGLKSISNLQLQTRRNKKKTKANRIKELIKIKVDINKVEFEKQYRK